MSKREHIFIIDDDPLSVFGLKKSIKEIDPDSTPIVFENGLDALESIAEMIAGNNDLSAFFFIDLHMPVLDGWDFLDEFSKIQDLKKHAPYIFIMTSSIDTRDAEKAKPYGLEQNYLVKPIYTEALRGILG